MFAKEEVTPVENAPIEESKTTAKSLNMPRVLEKIEIPSPSRSGYSSREGSANINIAKAGSTPYRQSLTPANQILQSVQRSGNYYLVCTMFAFKLGMSDI